VLASACVTMIQPNDKPHICYPHAQHRHNVCSFATNHRIRKGELKKEDIPYMQRGGSWDNNDVKGARKVKWLNSDKDYAEGGYKKTQSASIFGGKNLDWTGKQEKTGPQGRTPEEVVPRKKFLGIF